MGTRDCKQRSAMATPSKGEAGLTGQWRTQRPVVDHSRCTVAKNPSAPCYRCWEFCPEAVIERRSPIEINLDYCKGCGICAEECPRDAITMVSENTVDHADPEQSTAEHENVEVED